MKKRRFSLVLAIILSLALLSGCGSSGSGAPSSAPSSGADSETVTMPVSGVEIPKSVLPQEPTEINLISTRMAVIEAYATELEKLNGFENYKINVIFDQNNNQTQNMSMTAGGINSYQIMTMSASNFGIFSSSDWLYDLTPFIEKYGELYQLDDIPQSVWDTVTIDGKIFAIPVTVNMLQLFYRTDILEKEGLAVPATYDELISVLGTLVERGYENPYGCAFGVPNGTEVEFMNMMYAVGGEMIDKDTNLPLFNSDKGVEAMEKLGKLYSYANPESITWKSDDLCVAYQNGDVVIAQTWSTRAANMEDTTVSKVAGKVGYSPAVSVYEGNPLYSYIANDYFAIPYNVGDEAMAEATFLAMMEASCIPAQQAAGAFSMVTRASALTDANVAKNPQYPTMLKSMEMGLKLFMSIEFPFYSQVNSVLCPYLSDALAGNISYKEALEKSEKDTIVLLKDLSYIE